MHFARSRVAAVVPMVIASAMMVTSCRPPSTAPCGHAGAPLARQKVVVFAFENRTWSGVGGTQFQSMPYLNNLAKQCATFASYTEPNTSQNSATQYVGTVTGNTHNTVLNDYSPSASCYSTSNNIFRQARAAKRTAINYVEGATRGCQVGTDNAAKYIPDLYLWGSNDRFYCTAQVRPLSEFNPNNPPNFAFITPNLCDDGHDCGNATVNAWAQKHIQPVLNSLAYKYGDVTVIVWYDEDHPAPNMLLNVHARAGVKTTPIDWGSELRLWESLNGFRLLGHAVGAANIRALAGI